MPAGRGGSTLGWTWIPPQVEVAAPAAGKPESMRNPRTQARIAGLLYLLLAVLGGWAELYVRGSVRHPGDARATASAIAEHDSLFRLGIAADILMATTFVFLGLVLYRLLQQTHQRAATVLLVFVAVGAGSILINLTFHVAAWLVGTDPAYAELLGTNARDALAMLLLDMHHHGYVLGGVFFGLWLLPMGYFAYRGAEFPSWLGVLLMIGCLTWLADPVLAFAAPQAPAVVRTIVSLPTSVAEFGLILYLLVVGVRREAR